MVDSGLGVDGLVRVTLGSSGFSGEVWTRPGGRGRVIPVPFIVDGTSIRLQSNASAMGSPAGFDYVVAVPEYVENRLSTVDRWPNQGYATFAVSEGTDLLMIPLALLRVLTLPVLALLNRPRAPP